VSVSDVRPIALIGFGGIARTVVAALTAEGLRDRLGPVLVRPHRAGEVAAAGLVPVTEIAALTAARSGVVAECAGQGAVADYGPAILAAGIDLVAISVGALADAGLAERLDAAAARGGAQLTLPAGAIGGIDALAAMRLAGLARVTYCSRKPPAAWRGSPAEDLADLDALAEATVLYRGTARQAAARFPKNANVAATVALAGLGLDATEVALVADPAAPGNLHEIEAESAAGRFRIELQGRPSPTNPATSALTGYSLARALIDRHARIVP
jgi:aspartate dehydrogenase